MDALAAMCGADGVARGLTTYPGAADDEALDLHRVLVKLEQEGKVRRHLDMADTDQGTRFVIWLPVEDAPPAPAADEQSP